MKWRKNRAVDPKAAMPEATMPEAAMPEAFREIAESINNVARTMSVGTAKGITLNHVVEYKPKPAPTRVHVQVQDHIGHAWSGQDQALTGNSHVLMNLPRHPALYFKDDNGDEHPVYSVYLNFDWKSW